jgi:hypothetical protein
MQAEVLADVDHALAWWREAQANPARLDALVNEARERQRARTKQGALYRRRHDRVHWVMGRAGVDGAVRSII